MWHDFRRRRGLCPTQQIHSPVGGRHYYTNRSRSGRSLGPCYPCPPTYYDASSGVDQTFKCIATLGRCWRARGRTACSLWTALPARRTISRSIEQQADTCYLNITDSAGVGGSNRRTLNLPGPILSCLQEPRVRHLQILYNPTQLS